MECSVHFRHTICSGQLRPQNGDRAAEQNIVGHKASIVPNPAQDQFTVQVQDLSPDIMLRVQVINLQGATVHETTVPNGHVLTHAFAAWDVFLQDRGERGGG